MMIFHIQTSIAFTLLILPLEKTQSLMNLRHCSKKRTVRRCISRNNHVDPFTEMVDRQQMIKTTSVAAAALVSSTSWLWNTNPVQAVTNTDEKNSEDTITTTNARIYRVVPDATASLNPKLFTVDTDSFLQRVAASNGGALWLGEHHNSIPDHQLQANMLRTLAMLRSNNNNNRKPMAVGLEQVQVMFQPVLDQYIAGSISIQEMRNLVEWDRRWSWPFEAYQPIFLCAKELQIPLIALNVNSEDLSLVQKNGLPGLPKDRLFAYINDAAGFGSFATQQQFKTYVNYVIQPSYELHQSMGLLDQDTSFRNFLSGRILWDEAMATNAYRWTQENKGGLIVGLVGADHVKFRNGIPGRFARMAQSDTDCISVMLNPTLIDTRPPGTVANTEAAMSSQNPDIITLQLRYLKDDFEPQSDRSSPEVTGGVLPLADYIVIG